MEDRLVRQQFGNCAVVARLACLYVSHDIANEGVIMTDPPDIHDLRCSE